MKVYIVTEGEYSEYHIEGVFLDKKKAEEYCALMNRNDYGWMPSAAVEEYTTEDDSINTGGTARWLYSFRPSLKTIDISHKTMKPWETPRIVGYDKILTIEPDRNTLYACGYVYITFTLSERNDSKAKKIAYDALAEYKANQEGIT